MKVVNHSELPCSWNWLKNSFDTNQLNWVHASSQAWSRTAKLPGGRTLSRTAAAFYALSQVGQKPSLLVSHGPRSAMYASALDFGRLKNIPHLAFSFNFTELPSTWRQRFMARSFKSIDRFTVFSTMERDLYSRIFDINPERIDMVHWAVQPHEKSQLVKPVLDARYLCAIGSQGRDYRILMEVMSKFPTCRLHLVAHSENLINLKIPANVTVHKNVPFEFCASLVAHADAMILPLRGSEVPCGHVTAVMAMHLGIPVIATDSIGLHDYLQHGKTAALFPAGQADSLKLCLELFFDEPAKLISYADNAQKFARKYCTEERTIDYFHSYIKKTFGLSIDISNS